MTNCDLHQKTYSITTIPTDTRQKRVKSQCPLNNHVFMWTSCILPKVVSFWLFLTQSDLFYRYVFWYHNARMINFDSERGISVTTTPGRRTHSQLSIKKAEVSDSGNYTCAPSNSLPASIQVFVSGKSCDSLQHQTFNKSGREQQLNENWKYLGFFLWWNTTKI